MFHNIGSIGIALDVLMFAVSAAFLFGLPVLNARRRRRLQARKTVEEGDALARSLGLVAEGADLRGSRDGVLILMSPAAEYNEMPMYSIRLLDPKGPAGVDFHAEGVQEHSQPSGPDVQVGDQTFDAAVHVSALEPSHAVAALSPQARELVAQAVRQGWERTGAEWVRPRIGVEPEAMEFEIRRGLAVCAALRLGGVAVPKLLRERMHDPCNGVARLATRMLLEQERLTEEELVPVMQSGSAELAVMAALQLGEQGMSWLRTALSQPHVGLHAAIALSARPSPPLVEPLLLGGLEGPLRPQVLVALGQVGTLAAVQALQGARDGQEAVKQIQARLATTVGGVSIVSVTGGELSMARVPEKP